MTSRDSGGHIEAVAVLYEKHALRMTRFAFVLTHDMQAAEDLVQEAFMRMVTRYVRLRSTDAAVGYLFRAIINLARSRERRARISRRHLMTERPVPTPDPAAGIDASESDLWERIGHLPHRQRAALYLRFFEDLSISETARRLDISEGAVKSLCNRAFRQLRSELPERSPR